MQNRIDEIRWRLTAQLAGGDISYADATEAIQAMSQLPVETEEDRRTHLSGFLDLANFLVEHGGEGIGEAMVPQRDAIQQKLALMYQPGSVYLVVNEIIAELAEGVRSGGSVDELAGQALAGIGNLDTESTQEDIVFAAVANIRVLSMVSAANWLSGELSKEHPSGSRDQTLWSFWQSVADNGINPMEARQSAETILQLDGEIDTQSLLEGLMILFGLSLLVCPDCGPGLESIQQRIAELMQQLPGEQTEPPGQDVSSDLQSEPDRIVFDLSTALSREGFSEYRLTEASNRVQQLPTDTLEQSEVAVDTLNRVIDTAFPYAPDDYKPSMLTLKEWMTKLITGEGMEEITSMDEFNTECYAVRDDMRRELEEGKDPGAAFTKATFRLNFMILRAADNLDEEMLAPLMKVMMEELPKLMSRFVPDEKKQTWRQAQDLMSTVSQSVEEFGSDDGVSDSLVMKRLSEQSQRMIGSVDFSGAEVPAHVSQFVELILALSSRLTDSALREGLGESDDQELERLSEAIKADFRMIEAASTEEQILRHQKGGLRRSALELRKFERRRLLMIADPMFPSAVLPLDANSVFFSGSASVGQSVDQACKILDMRRPVKSGLADYTHGRWQQLRSAGVAVMDYSEYDAALADPEEVPQPGGEEDRVLGAAAQVAQVAYETGWALALGVPMIVTARRGQTLPFDVDIAPILLEGEEEDRDLLLQAIQIALYGVHRRVAASTLEKTIDYARGWFPQGGNASVDELFEQLAGSNDATRVRLVLESAFDRLERKRPLLIVPAFEGAYPQTGLPRLFHVTAFRTWSKVAEQQMRSVCERHGIEYVIGYERLDSDIMRAVWKDICRASLVVVDITNLNPNALLELGIAHALGRPVLIITQNQAPHAHLPVIQRLRTHSYAPQEPDRLAVLLDRFVTEQPGDQPG